MSSRSLPSRCLKPTRDRQRNQKFRRAQHHTIVTSTYHKPQNVTSGGYMDSLRRHL
jgi:hypothetical protein